MLRQILPWQMKSTFIIICFSLFCPEMPCFARDSGVIVKCSEITDCGKSEQSPASCYYLLVVKLVVKRKFLLLRVFTTNRTTVSSSSTICNNCFPLMPFFTLPPHFFITLRLKFTWKQFSIFIIIPFTSNFWS